MNKLKVALGQLDVHLGKPEENISRAMTWIEEASRLGCHLILLPELWMSGYDLEHIDSYAQRRDASFWNSLTEKARECNIFIGGTLIEKDGEAYFNSSVIASPEGTTAGRYRKIHLFRSIEEDRYFSSGSKLELLHLPWGKTGLATCYDLRFPEMFREYALAGAQIILLPAEWPARRLEHWRTLIRARAIENQLFIVAVNACGFYHSEPYGGHSAVISPWGEALIEADDQERLLTVALDLGEINKVRDRIPIFMDRHPEAYHL